MPDSSRTLQARPELLLATSTEATWRVSSDAVPKTTKPFTGSISKVAEAGGRTVMAAGCTRTGARLGGAVPSLPGAIAWMATSRSGVGMGATGVQKTPFGRGSNGVMRFPRLLGGNGRSAQGQPRTALTPTGAGPPRLDGLRAGIETVSECDHVTSDMGLGKEGCKCAALWIHSCSEAEDGR